MFEKLRKNIKQEYLQKELNKIERYVSDIEMDNIKLSLHVNNLSFLLENYIRISKVCDLQYFDDDFMDFMVQRGIKCKLEEIPEYEKKFYEWKINKKVVEFNK